MDLLSSEHVAFFDSQPPDQPICFNPAYSHPVSGTAWSLAELSTVISTLIDAPPDGVKDLDGACSDYFKVPHYARDYINYLQVRVFVIQGILDLRLPL